MSADPVCFTMTFDKTYKRQFVHVNLMFQGELLSVKFIGLYHYCRSIETATSLWIRLTIMRSLVGDPDNILGRPGATMKISIIKVHGKFCEDICLRYIIFVNVDFCITGD